MVKNLAASGQGFDPWSGKIPYTVEQLRLLPQLLSLCPGATLTEPVYCNYWAHVPRACAPQEKSLQWGACLPQRRVALTCHNQRKPTCSNKDLAQPKTKKEWLYSHIFYLPDVVGIVCVCVCVCLCELLSCVQIYDPMDCSPLGSSVLGILQERILKWVAISYSRDLPNPGIEHRAPSLQAYSLLSKPPGTL